LAVFAFDRKEKDKVLHQRRLGRTNKILLFSKLFKKMDQNSGILQRTRWRVVQASNAVNAGTTSSTHFFERVLGPMKKTGFFFY